MLKIENFAVFINFMADNPCHSMLVWTNTVKWEIFVER